mmetsp:Transcript_35581/g.98523  ORF Transcript_35581/g.98523 Transcript_35581/m.98523 type:complete len:91 (-) Transcript_35581:14-286(-)
MRPWAARRAWIALGKSESSGLVSFAIAGITITFTSAGGYVQNWREAIYSFGCSVGWCAREKNELFMFFFAVFFSGKILVREQGKRCKDKA